MAVRRARPGVTLIELLVSLVIMTIVMAAVTSAIMIATHALPDPAGAMQTRARSREVVDGITRDLFCATALTVNDKQAIELTVTRKGAPASIGYEWLGSALTAGPLTREQDGGAAVTLLDDVRLLSLDYEVQSVDVELPPEPVESAEDTIASYISTSNLSQDTVKSDVWWGETFPPVVPAEAVSWSVTRVLLHLRQAGDGTPGSTLVQIRPALPDGTPDPDVVLDEVTVLEANLNLPSEYYSWVSVPFDTVVDVPVDQRLCLILRTDDAQPSCEFRDHPSGVALADAGLLRSTDGGVSWQLTTDAALRFSAYGTYTTLGAPQVVSEDHVVAVHVTLQPDPDVSSTITSAVQLLNRPIAASGP